MKLPSGFARKQIVVVILVIIALGLIIGGWLCRPQAVASVRTYGECIEAGYPVVQSDPPVCRAGAQNFTGPRSSQQAIPPIASVDFEVLVDGDTKDELPFEHQIYISQQSQWQLYWAQVHAGINTTPPIIPVDFSQSSVIGLSLGAHATSGYVAKIKSIKVTPTGSNVFIAITSPSTDCPVQHSLTNRYLIVRSVKLTEPVSFTTTPDIRTCQ